MTLKIVETRTVVAGQPVVDFFTTRESALRQLPGTAFGLRHATGYWWPRRWKTREAAEAWVNAPELQHGIRNFIGGLVRVGERGEELVRLPRGSDVIPHGGISPALRQQAQQAPSLSAHAEVNITTSLLKDFME